MTRIDRWTVTIRPVNGKIQADILIWYTNDPVDQASVSKTITVTCANRSQVLAEVFLSLAKEGA